ncbi:MAG TPA: helix-turn-helix domain-containing protein [Candidatus Methylomirabilis sp.]|nr:helix-turn-helix domain-containing protein [Candidatus Methylomirabilis sp.]
MKDITPILRSLGLLDSEIKTYMAALDKGPQTVLDLSKLTKLSRQATYVAIDALTERGLMSSALRGKKRFFAAEHPDKLLVYAKRHESDMHERVKDLERSLPELELQIGGERPIVKVFDGKEGIRALLADLQLSKPKQIHEMTDLDAMRAILSSEDLKPVREEAGKGGARIKGIYSGKPAPTSLQAERYILPSDKSGFKTNVVLYKNKIALVTFEGRMHTIMVENAAIANTLRILFDLAFTCLPMMKDVTSD